MNADGSGKTALTSEAVYLWGANWSPDAQTLVFAMETDCPQGQNQSCNREIYTMPATGGAMTRLTYEPANDWSPVWAPR